MEMETSGSADEGSGCENSVTFNYVEDSDEEGGGLADAFMQFEAQSNDAFVRLLGSDGLMEEVLEHHDNRADEIDEDLEHGSLSPLNTLVEEVLDGLTMECFSSTVVPQVTSS
ncbi:unnamed protein product [Phytophthora lilii]|uniref:Unnamed protein product n=1 Tax=Phytophthora lilii TaxID=2077276 RepID=A0A9W6XL79_9STRA|nr:unnamed protein product [Phytophthora lilii]